MEPSTTAPICTLNTVERDTAVQLLRNSRTLFLDAVSGLTSPQAAFRAAGDSWSVADISEHLATFEGRLTGWMEKFDRLPASERPAADNPEGKDAKIVRIVASRGRKVQAPEQVRPTGRFSSLDDAVASFTSARDANIATVAEQNVDFRAKALPHPFLGPLDLYQWFLFAAAHAERHTKQILEVKADPGFPK